MRVSIALVLELVAFFCFVAAALGVPARVNLVAAGLALITLAAVIA